MGQLIRKRLAKKRKKKKKKDPEKIGNKNKKRSQSLGAFN
jgi:hypothetical protein